MGPVVVFLSMGRCGTQWLAATFAELYGESAEVEHEPLNARYWPRRFFRSFANAEAILELPQVAAHVERVARSDYYVETYCRCSQHFQCWPPGSLTVCESFTSHDTPCRRLYLGYRTTPGPADRHTR